MFDTACGNIGVNDSGGLLFTWVQLMVAEVDVECGLKRGRLQNDHG
jgi:hypothetical protein